ncbi:MAG: S8 family serine peptidase [Muribaculaceae bacterium]|nr:S8 family serine peptidase [Muribaculaceae bacterium]
MLLLKNLKVALRRAVLLAVLLALAIPAIAQESSKFSISTQLFLDELNGKIDRDVTMRGSQQGLHRVDGKTKYDRWIASPDTINGEVFMSAFVRIEDESVISELEALGVQVQEKFLNGKLITALIPIDKIAAVGDIAKVNRVNAATMMKPATDEARKKTNVDDVITFSADAQSVGLPNAFDGSNVVLGVIDTGIDFQHIAFKDKNGNYRLKRAYVYNGSRAQEYTSFSSSSPTTDDSSEDHGTHTSSTAGGSSVIMSGTNGSTVTVTDNHANATYGGMAPGADLYLAGINGLSSTYLSNAINKIVQYADQQGKPLVVSNSWGSQIGPHDGSGDVADIYNSLFGDSHPNRVALFAASNSAGNSKDNEGGGYHVRGTATSANPLSAILRSSTYSNTDAGYFYQGIIANAWARNTSVSKLGVKILVLDASTGAVKTSVTVTNSGSVSGLSSYYSGSLYVYYDQVESNKTQVLLYSSSGITSRSTSTTTQNGSTYYTSDYTLAIQVYPYSGASSSEIDIWGGTYGYFTNHLTTSGYNWTNGSDDMSVSDEAMIANVISIGAYVSKNSHIDYTGTPQSSASSYPTIGDIAYFSSYATSTESITGLQYPWITAPGARLVAAVNHYHTSDNYNYINGEYAKTDRVNDNTTSPYGAMQGTSMATPTAAGIVALWLQAANTAEGKVNYPNGLTVNNVKTIMKETAIHDSYTDTGANASHFGNGKIDALAGIEYILPHNRPTITATPTSLDFGEITAGTSTTKTFTVTGKNLDGNISLALNGANFSVSPTSVTVNEATNGKTITVTFTAPANVSNTYTGTITLSSSNATNVTVSLTGKGKYIAPVISANPTSVSFTDCYTSQTYTKTVTVTGTNLQGNITAAIEGNSQFTVSPTTITPAQAANGVTVTITYSPTSPGNVSATLKLTTTGTGANTVSVPITGTAQGPGISATPGSLDFAGYTGQTYTKTITVKGVNLSGNITATLNDANGIYSIDKTTITNAQASSNNGATITVTYAPIERGNTNATLTLSSNGVEDVVIPITGTAQGGTITATPTSVTFNGYATQTYTQTVNVSGANLEQDITVVLNDANGIYSIDKTSISKTANGVALNITWAPVTAGQTTATVVLSSHNADDVTINITGTAEAATPTLIVDPATLTFSPAISESESKTFAVTGRFITNDVTLTLNDPSGVFTLGTATIPAASISETTPVNITVSFQNDEEGDFTGSVTIACEGAETQTVTLNASVSTGGTASDAYLNIAKYATIDEAGKGNYNGTNLYKFTKDEANAIGWLTLPAYFAYAADTNQKWITTSVTSTNSGDWNENSPFVGSDYYGSNNYVYYQSNGNSWNQTYVTQTETFYVKNCTAASVYGYNESASNSWWSSSTTYTVTMNVYECTENANGTLTTSNTAVDTQSFSTASSEYKLTTVDLDESKIYKVEIAAQKARIYEVGFKTPLNIPHISANPDELSLKTQVGTPVSKTVTVTGKKLTESVTLTTSESIFSVSPETLTAAQLMEGCEVTVTFKPSQFGIFSGTLNLVSGEVHAEVSLIGIANDGNTAYDEYLDIANYSTIDSYDWYSEDIEKPYKFTDYTEQKVSWLTMPVYSAYLGAINGKQNWFGGNSDNYLIHTSETEGLTWSESDVFPGNEYYFNGLKAYGFGQSSSSNTATGYTLYFVTNCTAVKAYGHNNGRVSSYPARVRVYECTENEDGTLDIADSYTTQQTNTTQNSDFTITVDGLDASKIYVVQVSGARTYYYEVGFQTPLEAVTLADLVEIGKGGQSYRLIDGDLEVVAVSSDGKRLFCKDADHYANPSIIEDGQIDYIYNNTTFMSKRDTWDQSNWVILELKDELTSNDYMTINNMIGSLIKDVRGTFIDKNNPVVQISSAYIPAKIEGAELAEKYYENPNNYITCNFYGTQTSDVSGLTYFFVNPKPMEIAKINWAMWNAKEKRFTVPTSMTDANGNSSNVNNLKGGFFINSEYYDKLPSLTDGGVYEFTGLVKMESVTTSKQRGEDAVDKYVVYPIADMNKIGSIEDGVITYVNDMYINKPVVEVGRFNVSGQRVDENYHGVVIIVMSDGSARKILQK